MFHVSILQHVAGTIARQLNSWQFSLCRIGPRDWMGGTASSLSDSVLLLRVKSSIK